MLNQIWHPSASQPLPSKTHIQITSPKFPVFKLLPNNDWICQLNAHFMWDAVKPSSSDTQCCVFKSLTTRLSAQSITLIIGLHSLQNCKMPSVSGVLSLSAIFIMYWPALYIITTGLDGGPRIILVPLCLWCTMVSPPGLRQPADVIYITHELDCPSYSPTVIHRTCTYLGLHAYSTLTDRTTRPHPRHYSLQDAPSHWCTLAVNQESHLQLADHSSGKGCIALAKHEQI